MARPVQSSEPTEEQIELLKAWEKAQRDKAEKAKAEGTTMEIEIAPNAAYKDWAERVIGDWRQLLQEHIDRCNFSEEQKKQAGDIFLKRKKQLVDYLEEYSVEIADFQHELYRLQTLEENSTSGSLPYHDKRSAQKKAEALGMSAPWKSQVKTFEQGYINDLWALLEDEQKDEADLVLGPNDLETVDKAVTYLNLAVGAGLILGLFTRLSSLGGALFLLSVMATQPPWVAGAAPIYYQSVEMVALLVLATTNVGKWGGLDFFISCLLGGCCRSTKGETS